MKIYKFAFVVLLVAATGACSGLISKLQGGSPTQTLKNFVEASKNKDVEGVKRNLSAGSLKMMEGFAKMQNKTLDEALKNDSQTGDEFKDMPETRNEKISGDSATLEVKNKTGGWDTLPFIKENGEWKIAFDKFMEEMMNKLSDSMKDLNLNSNTSADDSTTKKP
jgi:Domain of unknown function (DUF4878)